MTDFEKKLEEALEKLEGTTPSSEDIKTADVESLKTKSGSGM